MESYAVLTETRVPSDSSSEASATGDDPSEILMSEDCPASIVVTESGKEVFRGEGPIIGQLDRAKDLLRGLSGTTSQGHAYRVINRFSLLAVSEALCNAVIHSDIAGGGEISVSVDEDFISITSPGPNCPLRHIDCGLVPRNPSPARALKERGSVNLCMSGIGRIRAAYFKTWQMPKVIPGGDSFTVLLPAITSERRTYGGLSPRITSYLSGRPGSTFEGICDGLMISPSAATMVLGRMESEGLIFSMGTGDARRFYIISMGKK